MCGLKLTFVGSLHTQQGTKSKVSKQNIKAAVSIVENNKARMKAAIFSVVTFK